MTSSLPSVVGAHDVAELGLVAEQLGQAGRLSTPKISDCAAARKSPSMRHTRVAGHLGQADGEVGGGDRTCPRPCGCS
jgi:hypothetical protein